LVVYDHNKHVLPTAPSPTTTHFTLVMLMVPTVHLPMGFVSGSVERRSGGAASGGAVDLKG
jgi:hypothetical protein